MPTGWPDRSCRRTERLLGTFVTLEVVCPADEAADPDPAAAIDRAFEWIQAVERCCSRFDATSELRRLCDTVGTPVRVSRMLFEALETRETMARLLEAAQGADGVRIFIGADNALFDLAGCSMVIAPYRNGRSEIVGAIGVIGPQRLNYARVIPMVDYTARVIGRLIG